MAFANKAIKYFSSVQKIKRLPAGIGLLNAYEDKTVQNILKEFYKKFFNDSRKRIFVWGINPGRFGGGLTGISFTDPVALAEHCSIKNNLGNKNELSCKFIYRMIKECGGVKNSIQAYF